MFKRSWIDSDEKERDRTLFMIDSLMKLDEDHQLLAAQLMRAIVQEFMNTKASAIGLSLELHVRSRLSFESHFLKRFFHMVTQLIGTFAHIYEPPRHRMLIETCFHLLEYILDWQFNMSIMEFEAVSRATSLAKLTDVRRPPSDWADSLVSEDFCNLISGFMGRVSRSFAVLICLASLDGPIFRDAQQKAQYARFVVQCIQLSMSK
jgi:hypothetical protein